MAGRGWGAFRGQLRGWAERGSGEGPECKRPRNKKKETSLPLSSPPFLSIPTLQERSNDPISWRDTCANQPWTQVGTLSDPQGQGAPPLMSGLLIAQCGGRLNAFTQRRTWKAQLGEQSRGGMWGVAGMGGRQVGWGMTCSICTRGQH